MSLRRAASVNQQGFFFQHNFLISILSKKIGMYMNHGLFDGCDALGDEIFKYLLACLDITYNIPNCYRECPITGISNSSLSNDS